MSVPTYDCIDFHIALPTILFALQLTRQPTGLTFSAYPKRKNVFFLIVTAHDNTIILDGTNIRVIHI